MSRDYTESESLDYPENLQVGDTGMLCITIDFGHSSDDVWFRAEYLGFDNGYNAWDLIGEERIYLAERLPVLSLEWIPD